MAFINWNEGLSVDVKMFDEQHKKLIGLINNLHEAMSQGKGGKALGDILKQLIDYTETHFKDEEKAMEKYKYPGCGLHVIEHKDLTGKVIALQAKYNKGDAILSMDVMKFLKDWLTHHILETDKKYGVFFKSQGIVF